MVTTPFDPPRPTKKPNRVLVSLFWKWLAWRLPKKLVVWCYIRVVQHATTGQYSKQVVPKLGAMEALKRWERRHGI